MSKTRSKKSDARQRIIETAERLFYAEGIRAVGIDRIIAEAEVAKMTLYNHFHSKDDLILAVVQYREVKFDAMFAKSMARHRKAGRGPVDSFFGALKDWFKSRGFRGCMFINTCAELADDQHPASRFAADHKTRFHAMLSQVLEDEFGATVAKAVGPAAALLVEGSIVVAVMQRRRDAADVARKAVGELIVRHMEKSPPT